ncbi:hypothetical protein [uncultured Dysgonomonas sp.]|uniref:Uncharacterized protein n=1 Tax=uncultured Dysgonomonas sp. TaxID=206096 RepID=A0A212J980_9BACT|nr:hypothetical protein [uncultured Dysgonomonas sp.]SBV95981.1 conserved membrane hypothetical protein [uncultured Dysgonomonas sp.]
MSTQLSISFFDIFKYWDTITQYVNPLTIILWAITGGVIGFIIVLIAELILRKKILVRRRHWTLKWLSYLYMAFLPLFAGFCFTQWFALHSCEREIVKNIPTYLGEANSAFNKYLKDEVEKIIDKKHMQLTGHDVIDKTASYAGQTASSLLSEVQPSDSSITAKTSAFLMSKVMETDFVKDQAVKYVEGALGEKVLNDKELTNDLLNVKIENILTDGVLNTIIEKKVKNIFGGFKLNILFMFILGLAVPIAEIILAHYLEKKRLAAIPPPIPGILDTPPPVPTQSEKEETSQENN